MKVLFISRTTLFTDRGGDTIQMIHTADGLRKLGVQVDIRLSSDKIDYASYDLIHFFNIIRPADILPHISKSKKPFVVSTIFVDYSEYEKKARSGLTGILSGMISPDSMEYAKALARFLVNGEKLRSSYYLLHGHRQSVQYIIRQASLLLPNSVSEYHRLENKYQTKQKYKVIPNGIDVSIFDNQSRPSKRNDRLVLCVARIEGRKNQLNLIRALANTSYELLLIGSAATNQKTYVETCRKLATSNIRFIPFMEQAELLEYYKMAKVHVLPSWFETTGLSSLEAAAMGCNIVITHKGDAEEYFKEFAYYCDPDSPESIFRAIEQASRNEVPPELESMVRTNYNWDIAAKKTLEGYQEILSTG